MAYYYYIPSYEDLESGESQANPYVSNYGSVLPQGSLTYSSYESNHHNLFHYDPTPNYHPTPYWAYSVSSPSEPKSIEYNPNCYSSSYDHSVTTQFVVSYSVSTEFDLPEFEEYDPTPYNGGYDINQTYGNPLPPSDEICYPPSTTQQAYVPLSNDSKNGSVESVIEKEERDEQAEKPHSGIERTRDNEEEEQQFYNEHEGIYENGINERNCYENEKQVPQLIPSGYGLEAMDLCESMFGYWPCIARLAKQRNAFQDAADYEGSYGCDWKGTADYLFGSSNPYGERRDEFGGIYGESMYSYEKHHQEQSLYKQIEYDNSWQFRP